MEKHFYKLKVSYRGSAYNGWQSQPDGNSVQDFLERALRGLHQDYTIRINGCSRTDKGVHAISQMCAYRAKPSPFIPREKLLDVLNHKLPDDICVKELVETESLFRPQKEALGKTYTYIINTGEPSPFLSDLCWHLPNFKNISAVESAAKYLIGKHDFSAFTVESERALNCVREIYSIDLKMIGKFLCLSFTGTSFLYRMVRRLVGALAEIGCGAVGEDLVSRALLAAKNSENLIDLDIKTAPPQGLFLMDIYYEKVPRCFEISSLPFI